MEKTEKKRILSKVLIVLAALTLLSCCFMGSTFAKYVTNGSGSASMTIADWNVAIEKEQQGNVTITDLSPDVDGASHSTGWIKVAAISNSGDVSAEVTVSVSELTVGSAAFEKGAVEDERYNQYVSDTELQAVFTVAFASDANGTIITGNKFTLAPSGSQDIYMQVTWTTRSDAQDTFFGEYLDSLTWTISYSAVQSSELPDVSAP